MSTQRFCEQCGAALPQGARFCEACGEPLAEEDAPPSDRLSPATHTRSTPDGMNAAPVPAADQKKRSIGKWIGVGTAAVVIGVVAWGFPWIREVASSFLSNRVVTPESSETVAPVKPPDLIETKVVPVSTVDGGPGGPGLIESGDFTNSIPTGIDGDGGRWEGPNAGNWSWRLVGPDDMAVSIPLKPSPGSGKVAVGFQMAIPEGTLVDPAIGGIRVRTRLMDGQGNSSVADVLLQPASKWQPVTQIFGDAGSGPYTLWIEALGFTGSVYLDQISANLGERTAMSSPPGAPELPRQEGKVPVETWFAKQPWMKELSAGLPPGVTLEVFSADMEGSDAHYAVEVRENHAPGSGFDTAEAPRWGIFQVSKDLTQVFYLSPVTNRPEPIQTFLAEAKLRLAALTGVKGGAEGKASELERWVRKQDWYQKLEVRMPKGVTLIILERDDGFEGWTAFEIREHHSAESGLDPAVSPLVGLFEVSPKRDGVGWFDPVTAEWQPIEDFLASRAGKK